MDILIDKDHPIIKRNNQVNIAQPKPLPSDIHLHWCVNLFELRGVWNNYEWLEQLNTKTKQDKYDYRIGYEDFRTPDNSVNIYKVMELERGLAANKDNMARKPYILLKELAFNLAEIYKRGLKLPSI